MQGKGVEDTLWMGLRQYPQTRKQTSFGTVLCPLHYPQARCCARKEGFNKKKLPPQVQLLLHLAGAPGAPFQVKRTNLWRAIG